jgi:hypothetical protein
MLHTDGPTVSVLTFNVDDGYDRGEDLIRRKSPIPL